MGKSKPRFVTAIAKRLQAEHGNEITDNFEENKKVVKKYVEGGATLINKVAGVLTRKKTKK